MKRHLEKAEAGSLRRAVRAAVQALTGRRERSVLPPAVLNVPVFVGSTYWTVNGVNIFSANLVRRLNQLGGDARILLTEEDTDLVTVSEARMPRPHDIPFESLDLDPSESWGRHWGRIVRYLAERAPCIYVPNSDWRHSCVCPRLPNEVIIVGVVHSDDPLHYDHARRIGHTWNAAVAVSRAVAERTAALCPPLKDRLVTVPIGVHIPRRAPKRSRRRDRLRLIYHGVLKQHQKRVLDLPRIVDAAVRGGVPVELTIVGAGPDDQALRAAAAPLVARGLIRFYGIATPAQVAELLAQHDVYLLASEFEGMPNALIEAMGHGCVPLVTQMTSGVPELVRDGRNGFTVPIGDAAAFADRLDALWKSPPRLRRLSRKAFRTVSRGRFRVEDMVDSYAAVFERAYQEAVSGRFIREVGELAHPPRQVAGVSLLPVSYDHHEPGVGWFLTEDDARDYRQEISRSRPTGTGGRARWRYRAAVEGMKVFLACPAWIDNGVNRWVEDLARGLRAAGLDARLLLTEESTELVEIQEPRLNLPSDIPVEALQPAGPDGWGARWGALTRLLDHSAPCFYFPNYDWRHSCVTPVLCPDVMVVGTVHAADALYLEHAGRLGTSWNAVVATNRPAAAAVQGELPELGDRLEVIPHGLAIPSVPNSVSAAATEQRVLVVVSPGTVEHTDAVIAHLTNLGVATTTVVSGAAEADAPEPQAADAHVFVRPNREEWLRLCQSCAVIVTASVEPEIERMLVEAMAHGCVPVLVGPAANQAANGVVTDGLNGLFAPHGGDQAIECIDKLLSDTARDAELRERARISVCRSYYTSAQMITAVVQMLRRIRGEVERGNAPQRTGRIAAPPQSVGDIAIFPPGGTVETLLGQFPSATDAERFEAERTHRSAPDAPPTTESVSPQLP